MSNRENSDIENDSLDYDESTIDAYIATKYFPPMYEASEETYELVEKDSIIKVQFDSDVEDNVFVLENVLTSEECDAIIQRGEDLGFEQSTVYSAEADNNIVRKDIRDNHRVLEMFPALSQAVWKLVESYFPEEIDGKKRMGLYKLWRYYRYHSSQNFAPHQDHVVYDEALDGCESRFTFILYLSDVEEGGETGFPNLKRDVKPSKGIALAFRHENWHEGKAVKQGVKYLVRSDVMYK